MRWVKKWSISPIHNKLKNGNFKFGAKDEIFKFEASPFHSVDQCRFHALSSNMIPNNKPSMKPSKAVLQQNSMAFVCSYGRPPVHNEPSLSREWFVQLWLMERRMKASLGKKKGIVRHVQSQGGLEEVGIQQEGPLHQPPISQSITGLLMPESPEEMKMAPLLARANLLITRDIEWANIMFGFEQENRYAVVDASYPQSPVGCIREQSNLIFRQLLRTRRPFIAHISDALGNELFRVRRPFWLINSSIYVEIDGKEVGVVHRRWHLWRRVYDLYVGYKQFAVVENPGFWNWTFTLKDDKDDVLAQIDRDWRGFGLEVFTDAGLYVIRFGNVDPCSRVGLAAQAITFYTRVYLFISSVSHFFTLHLPPIARSKNWKLRVHSLYLNALWQLPLQCLLTMITSLEAAAGDYLSLSRPNKASTLQKMIGILTLKILFHLKSKIIEEPLWLCLQDTVGLDPMGNGLSYNVYIGNFNVITDFVNRFCDWIPAGIQKKQMYTPNTVKATNFTVHTLLSLGECIPKYQLK